MREDNIRESVKKELNSLIKIANKYRDGNISESLFYDVIGRIKHDDEDINVFKSYLDENGVELVSGDEDIEKEEDGEKDYVKPYDTKMIDISPKPLSLDMIIARLENDEIDLLPDFQRKAGLWNDEQKSQLIESLILRIPLPAFYFDGSNNDRWVVIDGLQRLTAIKEFFVDKKLSLIGLEFLHDLENIKVDDMPRTYIRRMKETQIITYIINPGAPVNLKYNIFKRINTGGLKLSPQEIRHALYQGFATNYLKRLADSDDFKIATCYSVKTDRMLDREFVLRFIAFYELPIEDYKGSIDLFLNEAMEYINKYYNVKYSKNVEKIFIDSLNACQNLFGKFAFRRMPDDEKRRPISKALFETWTSVLARYGLEDYEVLYEQRDEIVQEYMTMCSEDKEFIDAIGSGKISAVRKRVEKIEQFVGGFLDD